MEQCETHRQVKQQRKKQLELPLYHGHVIGVVQDVTMAAGTDELLLQAVTSLMPAGASCVLGLGNSFSEVEMRTPVSSSQLRTAVPRQELISIVLLSSTRNKQTGDPDPWRPSFVSHVSPSC